MMFKSALLIASAIAASSESLPEPARIGGDEVTSMLQTNPARKAKKMMPKTAQETTAILGMPVGQEKMTLLAQKATREAKMALQKKARTAGQDRALPDGAHPVVIVGPLLGQSLESRITGGGSCDTSGDFHWHWGNPEMLSSLSHVQCLFYALEVQGWDAQTNRTIEKQGVEWQPIGGFDGDGLDSIGSFFGSPFVDEVVSTVTGQDGSDMHVPGEVVRAWLGEAGHEWDESQGTDVTGNVNQLLGAPGGVARTIQASMENFGDSIVGESKILVVEYKTGQETLVPKFKAEGYEVGTSLFGHSYDWRLGVGDWASVSFPILKATIEQSKQNTGAKAVLTGISMAGPYTHAFLSWAKSQDPAWLDDYVHAFVPVNAPFNGATMALSAVLASVIDTFSSPAGDCPSCNPPRSTGTENPSMWDTFKSWATEQATDALDENLVAPIVWKWPSMYFVSTGVDYSTDPPTDLELVTFVNGELPPQCRESPDASNCGATETRGGFSFWDDDYLTETQCAECKRIGVSEHWSDGCGEGFEWKNSNYLRGEILCCRKHECPAQTFKASELPALLRLMGREDSAELMEYTQTVHTTADPGVPVHCIISKNVQTWEHLAFSSVGDMDRQRVRLGDGDGTVDIESERVCERWSSTVKMYELPGIAHGAGLSEVHAQEVIMAVALNRQDVLDNWQSPTFEETAPAACRSPALLDVDAF